MKFGRVVCNNNMKRSRLAFFFNTLFPSMKEDQCCPKNSKIGKMYLFTVDHS